MDKFELNGFIEIIKQQDVKTYLEIGVGRGDTFYEIMTALPFGSTGVTVDLPDSKWGGEDSQEAALRISQDLRDAGYHIFNFFGPSQDNNIIKNVIDLGPYDLIFIDGDSSIEGVARDWINYSASGEMIAFNNISRYSDKRAGAILDTNLFWEAIKPRYEHKELLHYNSTGDDNGIGIIFK